MIWLRTSSHDRCKSGRSFSGPTLAVSQAQYLRVPLVETALYHLPQKANLGEFPSFMTDIISTGWLHTSSISWMRSDWRSKIQIQWSQVDSHWHPLQAQEHLENCICSVRDYLGTEIRPHEHSQSVRIIVAFVPRKRLDALLSTSNKSTSRQRSRERRAERRSRCHCSCSPYASSIPTHTHTRQTWSIVEPPAPPLIQPSHRYLPSTHWSHHYCRLHRSV